MNKLKDIFLEGSRVKLLPASLEYLDQLFNASNYPEIWTYSPSMISKPEDLATAMIQWEKAKEQGLRYPFVILVFWIYRYRIRNLRLAERGLIQKYGEQESIQSVSIYYLSIVLKNLIFYVFNFERIQGMSVLIKRFLELELDLKVPYARR